MRVDDLMEVMGAMAKLNRTIDDQQQQLNQYIEKFGPPHVAFADEIAEQQAKLAQQNGHSDKDKAEVARIVDEGLSELQKT